MGAEASKPRPGAKIQVIGAGLPRTGTASFAAALAIVLDGPVYHCGTQNFISDDPYHITTWMDILTHTPFKSPSDKDHVLHKLSEITSGYLGIVDSPAGQFVPELMQLYPDAKVICTIRDPDSWAKSLDEMSQVTLQPLLKTMLYWVPCMQYAPKFFELIQGGRWGELYAEPGDKWTTGKQVWEKHMKWLRAVVPEEKLVFVDVREGWGPLCRALGKEVPGAEFPRINDAKAIEALGKRQVRRGLVRWAGVFAVTAAAVAVGWEVWRRWT